MAADFNKPVTTDNYVDLLAMLRDNQDVLARMFASGTAASNIPNGSVRFDSGKFQTWNGSAWVDVPVSVDGGGTGAQSAADARVALGTNNAANLTTGVMDSARVPGLDASKIVSGTLTRDTSGNAATATKLQTARTIGGVSFDGSGNINLPGVNTTGNQNTTGSAAKLTTARTISLTGDATGSASFDGSGNVAINATIVNDSHNHSSNTISSISSAVAGAAIAGISATGIGSEVFAVDTTANSSILHGANVSGSRLRPVGIRTPTFTGYSDAYLSAGQTIVMPGTWKCLGYRDGSSAYAATLFKRIS